MKIKSKYNILIIRRLGEVALVSLFAIIISTINAIVSNYSILIVFEKWYTIVVIFIATFAILAIFTLIFSYRERESDQVTKFIENISGVYMKALENSSLNPLRKVK
jgi:hypothetical protein